MKLKICLLAGILAISYFYCLAQEGKSQFKQLNITKEEKSIEASDPDVKKEIVYVRKESKGYIFTGNSDVDKNIPVTAQTNNLRFALIIGNEDYLVHC